MNSQRLSQHTQDIDSFKSDKTAVLRSRNGYKFPLMKMLLAADSWWEKENQFSPVDCLLYISHIPGKVSCLGVVDQHKTQWFPFVCVCVLVSVFLSYCSFNFCLFWLYFDRERMNMKLGGEGGGGCSGRSCWRNNNKIYCIIL